MFKKQICKQHTPNMCKMGYIVSRNPGYTSINFIQPIKGYKVLGFYGKGKEQQEKLGIRKQHSKSHQNAKNSTRGTYHGHISNSFIYRSDQLLAFASIFGAFRVVHIPYDKLIQLTICIVAMLVDKSVKGVWVGIVDISHCCTFDLLYLIKVHYRIEQAGS